MTEAIDSYRNSWAFQGHGIELGHEFYSPHYLGFFLIITVLNALQGLI